MKETFIITLLTIILFLPQNANAQVLHTENFNVILDTAKVLKGNFAPSFRYRNLKEDFLEIANTADVSVRLGKHAFTIANRIEYSFLGDDNILSGGFLYLEYVNIQSKKVAFEPFYQMHWNEVRGLDTKYAGGTNLRWRVLVEKNTGLYFAIGSLFEFERWNYSGVPDASLPVDQSDIEVNRFRGNSYVSLKKSFGDLFDLDISGYYQPNLTNFFQSYRLASSFELTYKITKYIGLRLLYQNIYDSAPLVPIDKLYHDINFGIIISF
tara:strand:+ start:127 stop:927 length:801 start_codon:yes stop_codon:yes gene_type:complete